MYFTDITAHWNAIVATGAARSIKLTRPARNNEHSNCQLCAVRCWLFAMKALISSGLIPSKGSAALAPPVVWKAHDKLRRQRQFPPMQRCATVKASGLHRRSYLVHKCLNLMWTQALKDV